MATKRDRTQRWTRYWDRKSATYDKEMATWERRLFGDSRQWACAQAVGEVLDVAVGTGLNLPLYPDHATLTGVDISERMLDIARARAERLGRPVTLLHGTAHALPFDDASFDTVVCTFGLCAIPDLDAAVVRELLRHPPGGQVPQPDHAVPPAGEEPPAVQIGRAHV